MEISKSENIYYKTLAFEPSASTTLNFEIQKAFLIRCDLHWNFILGTLTYSSLAVITIIFVELYNADSDRTLIMEDNSVSFAINPWQLPDLRIDYKSRT